MVASLSCAFGSSNVNSGVGVGFSRTTSSGSGSPGSRRILALAVSLWLAGAALAGLPGLRLDSLADAGYARTGCCGGANTVQSSGRGAVVARWVLGASNRSDVTRQSGRASDGERGMQSECNRVGHVYLKKTK